MNEQLTIFDAIESARHAEIGIEIACAYNASRVVEARAIALVIAHNKGVVNMDDVMEAMMKRGHRSDCLGNSAGGVFRDRRFKWNGTFTKSARVQSHSNLLRNWVLAK